MGRIARMRFALVRIIKVRHRILRRNIRRLRQRVHFISARLALHSRWRAARLWWKFRVAVSLSFGSLTGLLVAIGFVIALPDATISSPDWRPADVHLVSAAILGTALALVLTLSIVPAQKAADAFSAAILKLYARDPQTYLVFALLTVLTLMSLALGINWIQGTNSRYALAIQFVILGLGLDALRSFYRRTLDLLIPATALRLVGSECERLIARMKRQIEQLAHVHQLSGSYKREDSAVHQWVLYNFSQGPNLLVGWITQLEEFAHKAVARRDTQAAVDIITTMVSIGARYADSRRGSLVVTHDFSSLMPVPVSDIGQVLNPIYEGLKNICEVAAKHPSEAVVTACVRGFGQMAVHAITMIHVEERGGRTAPLAYSPVFYLDLCTQKAIQAGMDDALLASVRSIGAVLSEMSDDLRLQEMEATAIDCLFKIAVGSYPRQSTVVCFRAVEMMLMAAHQELRVRDDRHRSILGAVLRHVAELVPLEVAMDKIGQRVMQTFPAYALGFGSNIPCLLAEAARRVKPVDPEREWVDPFNDFEEVSTEIVHHYRDVAEQVNFDDVLLQKWVLDSITTAAEIHVELLVNPPAGADVFLDTVDNRLQWFIYTPSYVFSNDKPFAPRHAASTCGRLAILGMKLLQHTRVEAAMACAKTIASVGNQAFKTENSNPWHAAEVFIHLEKLARAAEALDCPPIVEYARGAIAKPERISDAALPEFARAIATRSQQLDKRLEERARERDVAMPDDPVPLLRRILVKQRRER